MTTSSTETTTEGLSTNDILLQFVCPTLGAIMASFFFAAPVKDLRFALIQGNIGTLNTFPFPYICGNCLGWTVYGYYRRDPFVVAANIPGLLLSIWLNMGASKLQYLALHTEALRKRQYRHRQQHQPHDTDADPTIWDASRPIDDSYIDDDDVDNNNSNDMVEEESAFVLVPQEVALFRIVIVWVIVIVYVGWFPTLQLYNDPAAIIGVIVNINLVVLYGAPLQSLHLVLTTKNSVSIHTCTMIMNIINTTFWMSYGFAKYDIMIILPNTIGLILGLIQAALKVYYPSTGSGVLVPSSLSVTNNTDSMHVPIPNHDTDFDENDDNGNVLTPTSTNATGRTTTTMPFSIHRR